MRTNREIALLCAALLGPGACAATAQGAKANLHYKKMTLSPEPVEQPLLAGPPETAGMRSGRVVLRPGEHMHRHSTEANEELLVILQGKARLVLGAEPLSMEAGQILYIPPRTGHEVHNEGPGELRYVYIVAPAGHP